MSEKVIFILILLALLNSGNTLNILAVLPYQGKSHFFVFSQYLKELVHRGHNVTVISHFPEKHALNNYKTISLAGTIKIVEDDIPAMKTYLTKLSAGLFLTRSGIENCEIMLANEQVRNLINHKQKFDVIVVEQFNSDCGLGVAYKLGAPVVGITSHILMPYHYARFGIPDNPAFVNYHFLEGGTKPSLYQRVERKIFDIYIKGLFHYVTQWCNERTLAKYYDGIPSLEQLANDIKVVLVYYNFVLTGPKLHPTNLIEVGGFHVAKAKPLTGDLKKFIEEAENGVIYVSFGSVIKSSTLDKEKADTIINVMKELPYRFVWKWEDETLLVDETKLFVSSWLPQADILAHPKTVAFYSHAGMLGTTEGIHYGVPIVAMGLHGDQPANAAAIEESGLGVQIEIADLTKKNLLRAFKTVLDPSFRDNVKKISAAWHDRPMSPMDTAIYWTEYVARYPNITYKNPASEVPLYQYLMIDVYLVLTIIVIAIVLLLKTMLSRCIKRKTQDQDKQKKAKKVKRT